MSNPDEHTDLAAANAQLKASLEQCQKLVANYRKRLAANSNEQLEADGIDGAANWVDTPKQ